MSNPAEVYHHQHHHHHVQSPVHGVGGFGQALPPQTHHGLGNNNGNQSQYGQQSGQQGYNNGGSNTSPGQGNSYFNSGPRGGPGSNGPMNSNSSNNGPMNLNMGGPGHNGHHNHHGQGQGQGYGQGMGPGPNNRGYDGQQLGGQYPLDTQGGHSGHGSNISPVQDKPLPPPAASGTRHDHHHGHHRDGNVDPQSGLTQDSSIRSPTSGGPGRHHDSSLPGKTGSGGLTGGRPTSYGDGTRNSDLSSHSSSKSGNHHSGRVYDNTNSSADKYSAGTGNGMGNGLKNDSINTNGASTDTNSNNLNGSSGYGNAGRRHSPTTHEKVTFGDKIAGFTQKMSGKINKRPEDITDGEARMAGSYDTTY